MRSKLLTLGLAGVIAFLLATNPVVSDAAGKINGSQIKKNSITTKQIKDGSLKSADFGAGQIPAGAQGIQGIQGPAGPTGPFKGLAGSVTTVPAGLASVWTFIGGTNTVTLNGSQALVGTVTMSLTNATQVTAQFNICFRLVGASGTATEFRANTWHDSTIQTIYTSQNMSATTNGVIAAGNYTVGACMRNNSAAISASDGFVDGWVQVVPSASVVKPAPGSASRR